MSFSTSSVLAVIALVLAIAFQASAATQDELTAINAFRALDPNGVGWGWPDSMTTANLCASAGTGTTAVYTCESDSVTALQIDGGLITSPLPTEVGLFSSSAFVSLIVKGNPNMGGTIPTEINNLAALTTLELSDNGLTGTIPDLSALTQITRFNLQDNQLTGTFPTFLATFASLTNLSLKNNRLSGNLASDATNFVATINFLDLAFNNFRGEVPATFWSSDVDKIYLNDNCFTGELPATNPGYSLFNVSCNAFANCDQVDFCGINCDCECEYTLPAATSDPASINFAESGFSAIDSFSLVVDVPYLEGRTNVIISALENPSASSPLDAQCLSSAGSSFWDVPFEDGTCVYKNQAVISPVNTCGLTLVDTTSDEEIYEGFVTVDYQENVGELAGVALTRAVTNNLYYRINYQKTVQVSTGIVSIALSDPNADANPTAAILSQTFSKVDASTNQVELRIAVGVDYPFILTETPLTISSTGTTSTITLDADASQAFCGESVDQGCLQFYDVVITLGSDCFFIDSNIGVQIGAECNSLSSGCYAEAGSTVDLVLSVETEDQCPSITDTVDISGVLSVFEDAALTTAQTTFPVDSLAYFQPGFTVSSQQGSVVNAVDFSKAALSKVELLLDYSAVSAPYDTSISGPVVIFDSGSPQTVNGAINGNSFTADLMDGTSVDDSDKIDSFSLIVDANLFVPDANGNYAVRATYTIDYGLVKRDLSFTFAAPNSRTASVATRVNVEEPIVQEYELLSAATAPLFSYLALVLIVASYLL